MRRSSAVSRSASACVSDFPACACTSLANASSFWQALGRSPAMAEASASSTVCSFAPRLVMMPCFASSARTLATTSEICVVATLTVTAKLPLAWLPDASVAVQVTVVVPIAKTALDAGAQTTAGAGSTTSVAAAAYDTMAPPGEVASTANDAGNKSVGAVVSATVRTKLALAVFPAASVAVHATVVEPCRNRVPDVGPHVQIGLGSRSTTL